MDHHPLAEAMGDLESNITPAPPGADDRYLQSILESLSQARVRTGLEGPVANRAEQRFMKIIVLLTSVQIIVTAVFSLALP
jgi:hypothetical protein